MGRRGNVPIPNTTVNTWSHLLQLTILSSTGFIQQSRHLYYRKINSEWVLNSCLVVFVLCSYFLWKQVFKECLVNQCGPFGRERTCPVVSPGEWQLKWTNHIDCLWARLQILIWLGGLPGTQALHTHCGDWFDFKPAQDAREFVCCRVRGPFNPHVLLTRWQRHKIKTLRRNQLTWQGTINTTICCWFCAKPH